VCPGCTGPGGGGGGRGGRERGAAWAVGRLRRAGAASALCQQAGVLSQRASVLRQQGKSQVPGRRLPPETMLPFPLHPKAVPGPVPAPTPPCGTVTCHRSCPWCYPWAFHSRYVFSAASSLNHSCPRQPPIPSCALTRLFPGSFPRSRGLRGISSCRLLTCPCTFPFPELPSSPLPSPVPSFPGLSLMPGL